eukprot:5362602-Pyramimonas_sp.AAC.1
MLHQGYNPISYVSRVGDDVEAAHTRRYSDADLASNIRVHRSISANRQVIWGPYKGESEHGFPTSDTRFS